MKIKIILIVTFCGLMAFACKQTCDLQLKKAQSNHKPRPLNDIGEDSPIVMVKPVTATGGSIIGAYVQLYNGVDTAKGLTDGSGEHQFVLPLYGSWHLTITHAGYSDLHKTLNIVDSFTQSIDTLH